VLLALKFPELALWMNHIVTPGHLEQDAAPVVIGDIVGILRRTPSHDFPRRQLVHSAKLHSV
jgi:hypothetical protein